ncbi:MAG: ADP-ribosylglycohydrolase family protein [Candidatus Helarchaeota archaeon]
MTKKILEDSDYFDKVYGGFYGKCIGSYFGIPLEIRPYVYIQKKYGEINYYVKIYKKGIINDDEMYEIVGLMALEKFGINLTSKNIAEMWLQELYTNMYTAEKAAFNNLKNGIFPPKSSIQNNLYYDFIGGQMKGEIWGLITPGNPDLAERYSRMDAEVAHYGEGVLGEIFISRIISAAFIESNPKKLIDIASKTIPKNSLYMNFIKYSIDLYKKYPNWRDARRKLIDFWKNEIRNDLIQKSTIPKRRVMLKLPAIHQIHVLPNIGLIIIALLYGKGDFGRSICIAGMAAYDTDCNCGNVGAIIGTAIGESNIPKKWKKPINDDFKTKLRSFKGSKISEISKRIFKIGKQIIDLRYD